MLGAVRSVPNIASNNHSEEQNSLEQEPSPAALLLTALDATSVTALARAGTAATAAAAATNAVQVLGLDGDDVVVVAELTSLGREAQVGDRGDGNVVLGGGQLEAGDPAVLGLVLQVQGQGLVLEVSQAGLGRDGCATETTSLYQLLD